MTKVIVCGKSMNVQQFRLHQILHRGPGGTFPLEGRTSYPVANRSSRTKGPVMKDQNSATFFQERGVLLTAFATDGADRCDHYKIQ